MIASCPGPLRRIVCYIIEPYSDQGSEIQYRVEFAIKKRQRSKSNGLQERSAAIELVYSDHVI